MIVLTAFLLILVALFVIYRAVKVARIITEPID